MLVEPERWYDYQNGVGPFEAANFDTLFSRKKKG
jgi:hypothetical protein